jgi:hypothetical protein
MMLFMIDEYEVIRCCSWLMNYYVNVYVDEYDVICCSWLMKYYMKVYVDEYDVTWLCS